MFGNEFSEWFKIDMGTPQGSVLGPIIFLIYINDLLNEIQTETSIIPSAFADDICLVPTNYTTSDCSFQQLILTLQKGLDICSKWATKWGMNFSQEKSNLVVYRYRKLLTIKILN
jgi:hypothetical protein